MWGERSACVRYTVLGDLKGALREQSTCSDQVGTMDQGGVLFMSLRNCICGAARSSDQGA